MKKYINLVIIFSFLFSSLRLNVLIPTVQAVSNDCPVLSPGIMVKVEGKPAIYVLENNLKAMYFPSGDEFKSWNRDDTYSGYYTSITQNCYDSLGVPSTLPAGVNFRPGSYIIKKNTSNQLFVIEPGNTVAKISQSGAEYLYGKNFSAMSINSSFFWPNYTKESGAITSATPKPHPGMIVKVNNVIYYVSECNELREVSATAFLSNRFKNDYIRELSTAVISGMSYGNKIENAIDAIDNRSQLMSTTACSGGGSPTPPPATNEPFSLTKDSAYGNMTVYVPTNNVRIGKFILTNSSDKELVLDTIKLNFAFSDDFSANDLYDVYVRYNNVDTSKKITAASSNSWSINNVIAKNSAFAVEVYASVAASAVVSASPVDEMITMLEFIAHNPQNQTLYSGPNGSNVPVDGQLVTASLSQPVNPPSAKTGTLALALNSAGTPADSQVLTGNTFYSPLGFYADATDEDIKLESVKMKITNNGLSTPDKIITSAKLYNFQTAVYFGTATISKIGNDWYAVWSNLPSYAKITAGTSSKLGLVLSLNTDKNAAGGQLKFETTEFKGRGSTSQNIISAGSVASIKSNQTFVVTTKPTISILSPANASFPSTEGGTQLEMFRFKVDAADNSVENTFLSVNSIAFTINRTDTSINNLKIYYLDGATWKDTTLICYPHLLPKWICALNTNAMMINDGQSRTYSLRADIGLKNNANLQTEIADFGSAATKLTAGDFYWSDNSNKYYNGNNYAFWWVDQAKLSGATLVGSGSGSLYDKLGPTVQSITLNYGPNLYGTPDTGDRVKVTFNEQIDSASIRANLPQMISASATGDESGAVIVCLDAVGSLAALAIRDVMLYSNTALTASVCKKYATNYLINGADLSIALTNDGTAQSTLFAISMNVKDANGNNMTQTNQPTPTGSF